MPARALHIVAVLISLMLLYAARLLLLQEHGPPDHDIITNWQNARQISEADFSRLFHHRSPLFNLFYGGLWLLLPKLHWLIAFNAALNVLAVYLMCRLVYERVLMGPLLYALLLLAAGMSVFLLHTSRYFTIESAGLVIFAFMFRAYLLRTERQEVRHWYWALLWLSAGMAINYKFALLLPVLLLMEWLQPQSALKWPVLWRSFLLLLMPVLFWSLLAALLGLPLHSYLGSWIGVTRFNVPNAALRVGKFQSDLGFYIRYLVEFESPLAWAGLLLYPWLYRPWQYFRKQPLALPDLLALFCYAVLGGMSLLLKAPRGLVFIYVPMYLLGFMCLHHLWRQRKTGLVHAGLMLSIFYCCWLGYRVIYKYQGNGYARMAAYLQQHNISPVAQAVGNGLLPYAQAGSLEIMPIVKPHELEELRQQGLAWVVDDSYRHVTRIPGFEQLSAMPAVFEVAEPGLQSPLIYLEHAEFTGLGYSRTMERWQLARQHPVQLRLIKLPSKQ